MFKWVKKLFTKAKVPDVSAPVHINELSKAQRATLQEHLVRVTGKQVWTPTVKDARLNAQARVALTDIVAFGDIMVTPIRGTDFVSLTRLYYTL